MNLRRTPEFFSGAGLIVLAWITWQALYGPERLPARIPTHFDAAGNPNGWGSPSDLWMLPVIVAGVYLLMTAIVRFPEAFNYPVEVTEVKRAELERITIGMIGWMKAEMVWLFCSIQWIIIALARGPSGSIHQSMVMVFVLCSLVVIFATVGWHIWAMRRAARPAKA
jgi:uncharacterized membrane protein